MSVQKVLLSPFHCKPRPSGVSLESLGLEYIPEVSGNRAEVRQNHDARKTVSATLTLKKNWGYISAQKLKVSLHNVLLCQFQCKARPSGVSLESADMEYIPQVPANRREVGQNHDLRERRSWLVFQS